MERWFTARRRQYLYRVALAGIAVLVGYGVLSGEHAALWVALLAPVLGLADRNVTPDPADDV